MSEAEPPNAALAGISPDNHAAYILVVSYIFILSAILVSVTRLLWRWKVIKQIAADDWLIIAATALGIAETAAITVSCKYGLGRHRDALSGPSYEHYSKSFYAAEILTVACVAFAKLSLISTFVSLRPHQDILNGCRALQIIVILWAISSIFAFAFQCDLPRPWDSTTGRCIDQMTLQIAVGAINIATDLGIVLLPVLLMPRVQMSNKQRLVVQALFACRLIVPVMTILTIISLPNVYNSNPDDQPWELVTPTTYSQIMLNLSLVTACIPSVKRFLAKLQTGAYGAQVSAAFELSQSGSKSRHTNVTDAYKSNGKEGGFAHGVFNASQSTKTAVERSDSITGLTDHIIVQTIDFKVEYEDENQRRGSEKNRDRRRDGKSLSSSGEGEEDTISVLEVGK